MKKINKVLSMLVAAVMLMGMVSVVNVSAAVEISLDEIYIHKADDATGTVAYATDAAYDGSRSIRVDVKSDGYIGMGDPEGDFGMNPAKAYGIEFYIKPESWVSGSIQLKPTGNDNTTHATVYYALIENGGSGLYLNGTNKGRWGLEKITSGDKEGWYKVWNKTAIISDDQDYNDVAGYGKGYMWYFSGEMKVLIDAISVYEWTGYTTSENTGTRGESPICTVSFEDPNAQPPTEPEIPGTGGDEEDPEDEPLTSIIPNKEDLITTGINLTPYQYNNASSFYGLTDVRSHNGDYSLYVDSTSGMLALGSGDDDFGLERETAYGMKFSIYVEENQSGIIQIKPQERFNGKTKAVYYTEITGTSATGLTLAGNCANRWQVTNEGNGWVTLESKCPVYVDNENDGDGNGIPDFTDGQMFTFEGKFKAFIDDVEFYAWGNYNNGAIVQDTYSELNFTTLVNKRDFEPVGNYVSAFKKSVSGNDVTVSVDIRNCTEDNYTAQLFLAVYNGDVLESIVMTEKTTVPKVSETATPTPISKTVTVPADRTMTMFLWNSLEGMSPLRRCESYSAVQ